MCQAVASARDTELLGGRTWLILDRSALTLMDSTGLSVLVECSHKAVRDSGQLALAALRPQPAKILDISGLRRKLPVYESAGDAIAALASSEDISGS